MVSILVWEVPFMNLIICHWVYCVHTQSLLVTYSYRCMWLYIAISYTGPPPAPVISTDFLISSEEDNNSTFKFTISWNSSFTSINAITSYIVTPPTSTIEGRDVAIDCPLSCSLDAPCQCTGLRLGERIIVNISAINCGTQRGEAVEVTVASCRLYDRKYISY